MRLYYSDTLPVDLPERHPFPIDKYRRLRLCIQDSDLAPKVRLSPSPAATDAELGRVHRQNYLQRVLRGTLDRQEVRRAGFPWSRLNSRRLVDTSDNSYRHASPLRS